MGRGMFLAGLGWGIGIGVVLHGLLEYGEALAKAAPPKRRLRSVAEIKIERLHP